MDIVLILVVFFSATASFCLIRILIPILRLSLMDQPNNRSSHILATPRGGGVSFVFIAVLASVLAYLFGLYMYFIPSPIVSIPLLALPLVFVSFLDDCHGLPASLRFPVQIVTAFLIIHISPLHALSFGLPLIMFSLITIAAVINFINFMDGLDGLVAGCMSVALIAVSIRLSAPWSIWALVGALMGFLLVNWSPAKVFMGDVGSTFLGSTFAALVLQASSWPDALSMLMIATPLLSDACICVLRRMISGQPVFQAHRLHLFQRLHQAGWSHARVSSLYIVSTVLLAFACLWGGLTLVMTIAVLELFFGIWLDQQVAVPFSSASRN